MMNLINTTNDVSEVISKDAEAFAKHAGRDTIRAEDIVLLARRNDSLKAILGNISQDLKQKDNTR